MTDVRDDDQLWAMLDVALADPPGVRRRLSRTPRDGDESDWDSIVEAYQPIDGSAGPPSLAWPGSGGVMALWALPEATTSMAEAARDLGSYLEQQGASIRVLHEGDALSVLQVGVADRGEQVLLAYARPGERPVQLAWVVHHGERDALVESGELDDAELDADAETEAVLAALKRYCAVDAST